MLAGLSLLEIVGWIAVPKSQSLTSFGLVTRGGIDPPPDPQISTSAYSRPWRCLGRFTIMDIRPWQFHQSSWRPDDVGWLSSMNVSCFVILAAVIVGHLC